VGQIAIVTGGGRGFGREIARALANAGATVAVVARSYDQLSETVALIEKGGGRAIAVTADVSDHRAVQKMVDEVERKLGPVSLLVNNAGRLVAIGPVWEVDPDEWWRDVEVNLRGTFLCSHVVLQRMVPRKMGRIINFTSSAMPYLTGYDCSKVAITRLTHFLASETKEYGISVFAISIGPTPTEMMRYLIDSADGRKWFPDLQDWAEQNWQPVELAGPLVTFLASGKADVLTGRWVEPKDDLPELIRRIDEIEQEELYVWSSRGLKAKSNEGK
jgi:NAD(P)-dependent dehydrogenase (short-subunit alcohol dehydrogenase family)